LARDEAVGPITTGCTTFNQYFAMMRVDKFKCVLAVRSRLRRQIATDEGLFGRS
jgi:hypothetical protein